MGKLRKHAVGRKAFLTSRAVEGKEEEGAKIPAITSSTMRPISQRFPPHRLLAILRGRNAGFPADPAFKLTNEPESRWKHIHVGVVA